MGKVEDKDEIRQELDEKQKSVEEKNRQILDELNKTETEDDDNLDIELKKMHDAILKFCKERTLFDKIIDLIKAFIRAFIASYLAYGVIYNHIEVTRLNALWMNLGVSVSFLILINLVFRWVGKINYNASWLLTYVVLIVLMCVMSNIGCLFVVESFLYVVLYFLIDLIVYYLIYMLMNKYLIWKIVR